MPDRSVGNEWRLVLASSAPCALPSIPGSRPRALRARRLVPSDAPRPIRPRVVDLLRVRGGSTYERDRSCRLPGQSLKGSAPCCAPVRRRSGSGPSSLVLAIDRRCDRTSRRRQRAGDHAPTAAGRAPPADARRRRPILRLRWGCPTRWSTAMGRATSSGIPMGSTAPGSAVGGCWARVEGFTFERCVFDNCSLGETTARRSR